MLSCCSVAWRRRGYARQARQASTKIPRVGILTQASSDKAPMFDAFRQGLAELGYVEGRNIILEFRFARGDTSRGPQLAAELVALPVDVIGAEGYMAATGRVPTFPRS